MKKSVLLSYDRYQQLLDKSNTVRPLTADKTAAKSAIKDEASSSPPTPALTASEKPATAAATAAAQDSDRLHIDIISACLPKRNRSKAHCLLEYIDQHPKLDWNKDGNLVVEKTPIAYSHIVDLLHDALNPTRHEPPVGYDTFYSQLSAAPRSLINNPRRKSLVGGGRGGSAAAAATTASPPRLPPPGMPDTPARPIDNTWKYQWQAL